jgi:anthraniloyl-CoA monooxygenase
LENFAGADPETKAEILDALAYWDDIDVHFKGRTITSGGHGFCGIERKRLLNILQHRCEALGVELVFEREVAGVEEFADADLIIASDGINSGIRAAFADDFKPDIKIRSNKFTWLGTKKLFDAFTFIFKETEWGWFQVHAYRFDENTSTFIVETPEQVWKKAGIDKMSQQQGIEFCQELFADWLDGHELITNATHLRGSGAWINFQRVRAENWVKDNVVLMGDAAHTAHFSIGSGTKLAMEDAIALAQQFEIAQAAGTFDLPAILKAYQDEREVEVFKIQSAARNSTEWFEHVNRYVDFEPEQFAYSLLTRSQRVSHDNLRLRDQGYLDGYERWFGARSGSANNEQPTAPMFTPFELRGLTLPNRVVVSPMAVYSAKDGVAGDFHLVHLGARAQGGAGLVFTEMTCVAPDARITPGCAGMWNDEHSQAYARIVDFVHENSPAKICLQLGHAGPKGSTRLGWEGSDMPLDEGNWPLISASAVPWDKPNQVPRAASRNDMDQVIADFVAATERGLAAGFDMVELHAAHGYLLSAFISPLSNMRDDEYGGPIANRLRFPLEVFEAMRAVWPDDRPMSVRFSATDWHDDGLTQDEAVAVAQAFADAGADLIDVSAGQTSVEANPVYGRMFQTPYSDLIRNRAGLATMAVGNIFEADHVNSIIAAGRADLAALARPHLSDPYWTLHRAAEQGFDDQPWPDPYLQGRNQYKRNLERLAQAQFEV